jgi:YesN/AraC family two-component response regulator
MNSLRLKQIEYPGLKLHIKNMVCNRCKITVSNVLSGFGVGHKEIELGAVTLLEKISHEKRELIRSALYKSELLLIEDKKTILIEKVKNIITELVHYTIGRPNTNFSDYLSYRLDYDYTYLANIFSATEGTTIERYMITSKIERVKELLRYNELSLGEIANELHYSSAAHLATQFKKITGFTSSEFKRMHHKRLMLESL